MPSITDELPSLDGDVVGGLPDGGGLGGRLLLRGVLVVDGVVAVVGLGAGAEGVAVLEGGEAPGAPVVSHVDHVANLPLKSLLDAESFTVLRIFICYDKATADSNNIM